MGIIELIFGKKKEAIPRGPATLDLAELRKAMADKKENQVSEIYPACKRLGDEAVALIPKLRESIRKVKEKNITKEVRGYEIAVQMKQKFSERAPPFLDSVKSMKEQNLQSIILFHNTLNNFIASISKITSDNRYLYFFFADEMKEFSRLMKEMCRINNEINKQIESKKDLFEYENKVYASLSKYDSLKFRMKEFLEIYDKLEKEIAEEMRNREIIVSGLRERDKELETLRQDVGHIGAEILDLRSGLVNYLSLLERPLKKFKRKLTEKWKLGIIDELVANPVDAYLRFAEGEKEVGVVFEELKSAVSEKGFDDNKKTIEKTLQAIETLKREKFINSAIRISELQKELESKQTALKNIENLDRESKKMLSEFDRKQRDFARRSQEKKEMEDKLAEALKEAEELSKNFLNREITLSDNS